MRGGGHRVTAEEVKDKLRRRHPATQQMGPAQIPGPWTCIEEWARIDLLALCATRGGGRVRYAVVGYEVKVDRSDYRSEINDPSKRAEAVACCHEFYFAVPRGLLHDYELPGKQSPLAPDSALYVPEDVGLVVVDGRGCHVLKAAPLNREPEPIIGGLKGDGWNSGLNALIRWVSARPDPRHEGVVEEARTRRRELATARREWREQLFPSAASSGVGAVGG